MMQARLAAYSALPGADGRSYQSVRLRPISRIERFGLGRKLRQRVPRSTLGEWRASETRPIQLNRFSGRTRVGLTR
jgi:hypothetical protein